MKLHVQPITGEAFRFYVDSVSHPGAPHLVDLESYRWGGQCDCENFKFRKEKDLAALGPKSVPDDSYRCSHIKAARSFYMDEIFPKLAAAIRRIDKPLNRLMEAQGLITAIQQSDDSVTSKINDLNDIKSHIESTIEQITNEIEV